jgi:hypothetical protein
MHEASRTQRQNSGKTDHEMITRKYHKSTALGGGLLTCRGVLVVAAEEEQAAGKRRGRRKPR